MKHGRPQPRWPYLGPPQRTILFAAFGILLGTAFPWAVIFGRFLWGSPLAITWTLWAGLTVLAAGVIKWRVVVLLSAALGGGTAAFFALWQTFQIFVRCGLTIYCLPGPGLGLLLVAGGAALYQTLRLLRPGSDPTASAPQSSR